MKKALAVVTIAHEGMARTVGGGGGIKHGTAFSEFGIHHLVPFLGRERAAAGGLRRIAIAEVIIEGCSAIHRISS